MIIGLIVIYCCEGVVAMWGGWSVLRLEAKEQMEGTEERQKR